MDAKFLMMTQQKGVLRGTSDIKKAQGLYFLCPKPECRKAGGHGYTLLFNGCGVPEKLNPPGRWTPIGQSMEDLALLEIIRGKCGWRGTIRGGEIVSTLEH